MKKTKKDKSVVISAKSHHETASLTKRRALVNNGQPLPVFKNSDEALQFAEEYLRRLGPDAALEIEHSLKFDTSSKERTATAFKILGVGGVREKQDVAIPPPPMVLNFTVSSTAPGAGSANASLPWLQRRALSPPTDTDATDERTPTAAPTLHESESDNDD